MERIKFNSLNIGETKTVTLRIVDVISRNTSTTPAKEYCRVTLTDGEERQTATDWDHKAEYYKPYVNQILAFRLVCEEYKGKKQFVIKGVGRSKEPVSIEDFVESCPYPTNKLYEGVMAKLRSMQTPLKEIAIHLYEKYREKLLYYPAAKVNHHAVRGGLLWHSYRMGAVAISIAEIYKVNPELMYIGAVLHDIGKLETYDADVYGDGDINAKELLYGHSMQGVLMVHEAAKECGISEDKELEMLLHMIASHHGEHEMGAVTEPHQIPAMLLMYIDRMDSELDAYEHLLKLDKEPSVSQPVPGYNRKLVK